MPTFSERFKTLRNEKKLTQEELIKMFNKKYYRNYTPQAISYYENGKRMPEYDSLQDFADFFGVTVSYLLGETDVRKPESSETKQAEEIIKVDPELFIQMCRAKHLPESERQKIKEYAAYVLEKYLNKK